MNLKQITIIWLFITALIPSLYFIATRGFELQSRVRESREIREGGLSTRKTEPSKYLVTYIQGGKEYTAEIESDHFPTDEEALQLISKGKVLSDREVQAWKEKEMLELQRRRFWEGVATCLFLLTSVTMLQIIRAGRATLNYSNEAPVAQGSLSADDPLPPRSGITRQNERQHGCFGWFSFLKPGKRRTVWDELQGNPVFQDQKALFDAMSMMCEDGCDTDEIPGGEGEFGYAVNNPIPTKTAFGSTSYLARLRSPDGAKVICQRRGSVLSTASPYPVDAYLISHPDGRQLATLYISPYHKRNSERSPKGFTLLKTAT